MKRGYDRPQHAAEREWLLDGARVSLADSDEVCRRRGRMLALKGKHGTPHEGHAWHPARSAGMAPGYWILSADHLGHGDSL